MNPGSETRLITCEMAGNSGQRRQAETDRRGSERYAVMQIFSKTFTCSDIFIWSMLGMLMGGSLRRTLCCLDPIPDLSLLSAPLLPYLVSFYFDSLKTQHRGGMLRLTSRNFLTPTHLTSYIYTKCIKVKGWRQNSYSHLILPSCKQSCLLLFTLLIAKRWIPSYWNLLNCCLPLLVSQLFMRVL